MRNKNFLTSTAVMNTGYPSYASSPCDSRDDYSPDSGFNSAYSSMFGSTGSQLGSSQDGEIHSSSKFGEFIHGKSPSWPMTQLMVKPSLGHGFPNNRSTSWSGQMKTGNDLKCDSMKSFFSITGDKYHERVSDTTYPENRTGHKWCDVVARATHREETLSPESTRRIFREATARNERLRRDRYSTSVLHSTPEKTRMMFPQQSPSVVDKNYAISRASGYNCEDFVGSCASSPQKDLNDLASCRRITLPEESVSSYETLKRPQSILMPYGNQWNDRNQMQVRSGYSQDASSCGLVVARAVQRGHNDALIKTLPSPNGSGCPTVMISESLLKPCDEPNSPEDLDSKKTLCSDSRMVQQIERLSLSGTSMLRKLSQEFYGLSAKHSPDLANRANLGTKGYRRFVSVDETQLPVTDKSPISYSKPDHNRCQSEAESRNQSDTLCQNGNGVTPSCGPGGVTTVGVMVTGGSSTPGCHFLTSPDKNIGTTAGRDMELSYPAETRFHEHKPDKSFEKISLPVCLDNRNIAVALFRESPPPPDLPPRKYRESSGVRETPIATSAQSHGLDLFGASDDDNFDSPATADNYAEQLRRQAKRLSHSHSSVFTSIHSPKVEQVALPGDHVRKLADRINQESKTSQSPGFVVTSIHSPRVKQVLLHSGARPNVSHFDKVPNDKHSITVSGNSVDTCSALSVANIGSKSLSVGNIHVLYSAEEVTTRKTDDKTCAKQLFNSDATCSGKSSLSDQLISVDERKSSNQEQKRVSYFKSISRLENQGLGQRINSSRNEEKNLSKERKIYKEKSSYGERNHLSRERNSSSLETASLSNKSDSSDERKFSQQERKTSSHERKSASQERQNVSHEIKSAPQERNSASQERKTLSYSGSSSCPEEHASNPRWTNLNQETDDISCQRNHSNVEKQVLSQERNSSSEERKSLGSDKNVHSSQERSLGQEGKSISCEKHSVVKERKDLRHELHTGISENDINTTWLEGKSKSPEKESSHKEMKWCSNHKISGNESIVLISSSDEGASVGSVKAKDVAQEQKIKNSVADRKVCNLTSKKIAVSSCDAHHQRGLEDKRSGVDLKIKAMCDESIKKNVDKNVVPSYSKGNVLDTSVNSLVLHSQIDKNREGKCKMVTSSEPHQENHFMVETPVVKATGINPLVPTNCEAKGEMTKPLNSISKADSVAETRKLKQGNPISKCGSEVGMMEAKVVHSSLEADSVTRAKLVINDSNLKPNESTVQVTSGKPALSLLNSRCEIALAKIKGSLCPSSLDVQEEIPSFLFNILPTDHKTATYYMAQLAFSNILPENEDSDPCSFLAVRITIQPYLRYLMEKAVASSSSSENHGSSHVDFNLKQVPDKEKLSVLHKIEDKLKDFEQEKQSIEKEVMENVALGHKMTSLAEQKLEPKEFGKYKLYVDELDKVLCLLLNISKRLASVENSIKSQPKDGSSSEMSALISKRSDLSQKYEDARALNEGIASRKYQVADYLVKCLSDEEFKSFEHFVVGKLCLFVEKQVVEDVVTALESKLQSLNSDNAVNSD